MGVSVYQQKRDSTWYVRIRHRGDRAAQKFATEEEARTVAAAARAAITLGQFDIAAMRARRETAEEKPATPTLTEYFKTFENEYLLAGVRASTREAYRGAFDRHIIPALGDKPIDAITRSDVKSFVG